VTVKQRHEAFFDRTPDTPPGCGMLVITILTAFNEEQLQISPGVRQHSGGDRFRRQQGKLFRPVFQLAQRGPRRNTTADGGTHQISPSLCHEWW
jgi:hypothetical protein